MPAIAATELILIRHAPALSEGRMAGRRDVAADCSDTQAISALRDSLGPLSARLCSPALRCRQTAGALWPDLPEPDTDARLWEQDFGDWEGRAYADLPDLGAMSLPALAAYRPPKGESFDAVCARVRPALTEAARGAGPVVMIVHAGVIRAALGLALGQVHLGLQFQIAPLSVTRLVKAGSDWSIACVNGRIG